MGNEEQYLLTEIISVLSEFGNTSALVLTLHGNGYV